MVFSKKKDQKNSVFGFKQKTATLNQLLGHGGHLLMAPGSLYGMLISKRIDPAFREEIMVAVATLNACKYCNFAHHDFALQAGVSKEDLAQLEGIDIAEYDERKFLAITYARELANKNFGEINKDLEVTFKSEYDITERSDIHTTARMIMLFSLLCNTADSFIERVQGEPVPDSKWLDEAIVAGSFFGVILPVVGLYLAILRRESPFNTMKDFMNFASNYQKKGAAV